MFSGYTLHRCSMSLMLLRGLSSALGNYKVGTEVIQYNEALPQPPCRSSCSCLPSLLTREPPRHFVCLVYFLREVQSLTNSHFNRSRAP